MYGYFQAGAGRARWARMPLISRVRLWMRRRRRDDLAGLAEWK